MRGTGRMGAVPFMSLMFLVVFVPVQVAASGLMTPKVEYSADQSMGDGEKMVTSRIHQVPGKIRMEFQEGGGEQAVITRFDRKQIWTLMISERMYMEIPMDEEKTTRDVRQCTVTSRKEGGKEAVNGISAAMSEFEATCPDGSGVSGKAWTTRDEILVKMDAVSRKSGKEKGQRVVMEMKNLKIGKQDPALFEIPPGFSKLSMPAGLPSMKDFLPKETKQETKQEPAEKTQPTGVHYTAQPREKEKTALDKAVETKDKIKSLFKW